MEKIQLSKSDFLKALEAGGIFAGKTKVLPILECVKIKVKPSFILITSGDNENWISKKLDAETGVTEEVSFCVNFKDLFSYVKLIKGEMLIMGMEENGMLVIEHKKGHTTMPTYSADDYPEIVARDEYVKVSVPSYLVNNWIVDGRNFVNEDDLRPILGNLYFYCESGEFGCCATNKSSLYWNHSEYDSEDFDFTLNRGAFDAVCKLCSDCEEVSIEIGSNNVKFNGGDTHVLARRVEGRFPKFKAVIPQNNPISVDLDRRELMESLSRCRLSANSKAPVAKLHIDGMGMEICCQDLQLGKSSAESIMVSSNGNITVGLDCNILMELMKTVNSDRVEILLSSPERPVLIREESESDKVLLQMPMQLLGENR